MDVVRQTDTLYTFINKKYGELDLTGTTFAFYRRLKGANSANVVNGVFLFCLKL